MHIQFLQPARYECQIREYDYHWLTEYETNLMLRKKYPIYVWSNTPVECPLSLENETGYIFRFLTLVLIGL